MQIVRQSTLVPTPWKNGGGTTREAIRVPATGAGFRWRVSLAQIDVPGPFSDFGGYHRKMVLLRGSGVSLTPAGGVPIVLRVPGDLAEFDGAVAMQCDLLNGPCTDLNLMVSTSIQSVRVWVQPLTQLQTLDGSAAETTLLLPISGSLTIAGTGDGPVSLHTWDLALVSRGELLTIEPDPGEPAPLVFFATLEDNFR